MDMDYKPDCDYDCDSDDMSMDLVLVERGDNLDSWVDTFRCCCSAASRRKSDYGSKKVVTLRTVLLIRIDRAPLAVDPFSSEQ